MSFTYILGYGGIQPEGTTNGKGNNVCQDTTQHLSRSRRIDHRGSGLDSQGDKQESGEGEFHFFFQKFDFAI
jgi:hypothetical protein